MLLTSIQFCAGGSHQRKPSRKLINKSSIQTGTELVLVHTIFNIGNPTETIKMLLELRFLSKRTTGSIWMMWKMRSINQNNKE